MRKMLTQFFRIDRKGSKFLLIALFLIPSIISNSGNVLANNGPQQEKKQITGQVTEAKSGNPLPGVTILIKGTTQGTITDIDGKFTIMASPSDVLAFSFVGYLTEEVPVKDQTTINVSLAEDIVGLDEVVVIGYGVQKKSDLTGAVASISADDIKATPVTRIDEAIEGRAAGVNVINSTGMPGGAVNIQIRGVSSINGFQPLIVVDGIPGGDLNSLNPSDIQSVEILKDAASAAIYGSSGGNGVVLITTKKGQAGRVTATLNMYTGLQKISHTIPLMNTKQWSQFYADLNGKPFNFKANGLDSTVNTDWQKELYRTAPLFNCELNVSGGSEKSQFSIGAQYLKQEGTIRNTNYEKMLISIASNTQIAKHIKLDEVVRFNNSTILGPAEWQYQNVYNNYTSFMALSAQPFLTPYDKNGKWSVDPMGGLNPFVGVDVRSDQKVKNMGVNGNVGLTIDFLKDFKFTSRLNGSTGNYETWNFQPEYFAFAKDLNLINKLTQKISRNYSWTFQNYITYNKTILNNHNISIMAGTEGSAWWDYDINGVRQDFASENPNLLYFDNSVDKATLSQLVAGSAKKATSAAYYGRLNYDYKSIFLAQFNFRRDGNSNFGPNFKWGDFYSGSVGFKFSELQAVKNLNIFSFGKIRVGIGQSGQYPVLSYWPYASTILNTDVMNYSYDNTALSVGYGPVQVPNPDLHWETVTSTNIGADLGFMENTLNVSLDYFIKNNTDMIMAKEVNSVAGTYILVPGQGAELGNTGIKSTYPSVNYGSVSNKGIELTVDYRKSVGDLKIDIGGNFTYQTNKITDLATDSTVQGSVHDLSGLTISKVGYSIGEYSGYKCVGIFKEGDKMVYNQKSKRMVFADQPYAVDPETGDTTYASVLAKPGDAKFADLNHDGKINAADRGYLGSYIPPIVYGFTFGLEYKGIDFSAFLQGVYGNEIFNGTKRFLYTWENSQNHGADFADRYHLPVVYNGVTLDPGNTSSDMPDVGSQNWGVPSDLYIEKGSYLRLKTLTLGYTLPHNWTTIVNIDKLRIYFIAKNLLTITKYSGYDPEVAMPTAGVNNQPDPRLAGIDIGGYPKHKMYTLGVNVTF